MHQTREAAEEGFQRGPAMPFAGPRAASATEPYGRLAATLVASWKRYAAHSEGAFVHEEHGAAICVFPTPPERLVYNNTLLPRGRERSVRRAAVSAMEGAYARAGVEAFAAWVHESDAPMVGDLVVRGYRVVESTRAMSMQLDDLALAYPRLDLGDPSWEEYLRIVEAPEGLLGELDTTDFHLRVARLDGRYVATALAFDHAGDCGIYNVGTISGARRRGLASALTALQLHEARERGCSSASLQSTPMAESVYAAVGFRDLGLLLELSREP